MRYSTSSCPAFEAQSPLKCLNNLNDPSPIKKLPNLLRNPFRNQQQKPAKRRLNLGSPVKRNKMLEIDEDANLEPPKMKTTHLQSKQKLVCHQNNWILNTKVRINFNNECKNWLDLSTSTHKRNTENSPCKLKDDLDNTISIEAIKNAARVYQHPYLAWQQLYPRSLIDTDTECQPTLKMSPDSDIAKKLHSDWAKSFEDLTNLLLYGNCPYFYMLTDYYTIFFRQCPSSNPAKPSVQAYFSPLLNNMGLQFNKQDIEFKPIDIETVPRANLNVSNSSDSANVSDFIDDEEGLDLPDDTSQLVEGWGIGDLEYKPKRKNCLMGTDTSSSQTTTTPKTNVPLAMVEGRNNLRKLIKFLQTNSSYTIYTRGKFAFIPATLLSPREFRLSTPQYPEVSQSKNMVLQQSELMIESSSTPVKPPPKVVDGSSFVELSGTILPNFHKELHKLLTISDNMENHSCQLTQLKSSVSFGSVP